MTILFASHNKNKISDVSKFLKPFDIIVKGLSDFKLKLPEEVGNDFKENSLIKARYALEKTGLPSLGDDSGFCAKSLNDFPGLCSARFAEAVGGYEEAFKILNKCINPLNKEVYFISSISFAYMSNNEIKAETFEGVISGEFVYPPRGINGFGYCSVFLPDGYSETLGEMSDDYRIKINHRHKALKKFVEYFKNINL